MILCALIGVALTALLALGGCSTLRGLLSGELSREASNEASSEAAAQPQPKSSGSAGAPGRSTMPLPAVRFLLTISI